MENRFEGKVAIATGAGAGIGKYCAMRLASEGAKVVLCDISEENVRATEKEILDNGGECFCEIFDLLDYNMIQKTVADTIDKYGRIDILVNSAGGSAGLLKKLTDFKDSEKEVRDWVINLNLIATMDFCHAVTNTMVEQKYGKIINISSIAAVCGLKKRADYSAAKAGLVGMSQALAMELGKYNISINCVSPGAISRKGSHVNGMTYYGENGRLGEPWEVANLVAFLASTEADYITGQNYVIDGGRVLGAKT